MGESLLRKLEDEGWSFSHRKQFVSNEEGFEEVLMVVPKRYYYAMPLSDVRKKERIVEGLEKLRTFINQDFDKAVEMVNEIWSKHGTRL